jgi:ATP-dependent exoDNAse (exonuclease V) beta subunit
MSELADADARRRAISTHDAHLAVEAGAGTGKTTILVSRLVDAIARGALSIHRFAAITFTELAAGELQIRLREELECALGDPSSLQAPLDRTARRRLEEAVAGIAGARISTIHAFCSRILREHPVAAGLDPEFTIVGEGFAGSVADATWNDWIRAQLNRPESCRPLLDTLAVGGSLDDVRKVAMALLDHPEASVRRHPQELAIDQLLPTLRQQHADLLRRARSRLVSPDTNDRLIDELDSLETLWAELEQLPPELALHRLMQLDHLQVSLGCGSKRSYHPGALDELKNEIRQWRSEGLHETLQRATSRRLAALVEWLTDFTTTHRAYVRQEGRLEFRDLLLMTRDLLQRSSSTLQTIRDELDAVLVDEFQDTDPVQAEIVRWLTDGEGPPYRFVVGDPKQSIYRFRHADVETYAEMAAELAASDRLVHITTNFRSRPRLLELVNAALSELFAPASHDRPTDSIYQAPWTDLEASPHRHDSGDPALVLLLPDCGLADAKRPEVRAAEADAVAAAICEVVRGGHEIADRNNGWRRRPARWSDCAILMPATTQAEVLEEALEARDVPYLQERSRSYYRRPEVGELLHVLSAVADPYDPTAVVAALRSRFIGIDDATLACHRAAGGTFTADSEAGENLVHEAIATLTGWHRLARSQPVDIVLQRILEDTRFECLLAVTPRGDRAAENVRKLVTLAEQFWNERVGDLSTFVLWLRERLRSSVQEREAPGADTANRVTILTMHGAKGLQWPVIALWDLDHRDSSRPPTTLLQRPSQLSIRLNANVMTPCYEAALAVERGHLLAERARLLYVAVTRAEELLILPLQPDTRSTRTSPTSPYTLLMRSQTLADWAEAAHRDGTAAQLPNGVTAWCASSLLDSHRRTLELRRPVDLEATSHAAREHAARQRAVWEQSRRQLLDTAGRYRAVTPSELHTLAAEQTTERASTPRSRSDALRLGSAVHRALELLLRPSSPADLTTAVSQAAAAGGLGDHLRGDLERLVAAAWSSDILARARSSERRWVELPLVWHTTAGAHPALAHLGRADQPVLVEGTADLVFADNDTLVVVDFKTDSVDSEEHLRQLVQRYSPQLDVYRAAINAAADRSDTHGVLHFVAIQPPRAVEL